MSLKERETVEILIKISYIAKRQTSSNEPIGRTSTTVLTFVRVHLPAIAENKHSFLRISFERKQSLDRVSPKATLTSRFQSSKDIGRVRNVDQTSLLSSLRLFDIAKINDASNLIHV